MAEIGFFGTADSSPQPYERDHARFSRRVAAEGIVLLKNENGVLPLNPKAPVALFGGGAVCTVKGGQGSGDVNTRYTVSVCEGLERAGFSITTHEWLEAYARRFSQAREDWRRRLMEMGESSINGIEFFEKVYAKNPFVRPEDLPVYATPAKTAIFVVSRTAGEAADRKETPGDYFLSAVERQGLENLTHMYEHVVVVLNTGGVVDLSFLDELERIDGLIYLAQPGMEGGNALAEVLSGQVCPSGKLTDTWALHYGDYPGAGDYSAQGSRDQVVYEEGIYVGYRYFDTFQVPVRFGFGFGLSYTSFALRLEYICQRGERAVLKVSATNTGTVPGKEVAQLYATCPIGAASREFRHLVAFEKTGLLTPGETECLELSFSLRDLAWYDEVENCWRLDAGRYILWLGNSLASAAASSAVMVDRPWVRRCAPVCPPGRPVPQPCPPCWEARVPSDYGLELRWKWPSPVDVEPRIEPGGESALEGLTQEDLIRLVVGDEEIADESRPYYSAPIPVGAGGMVSSCATEKGVPGFLLCDGPAGLRLSPCYEVVKGRVRKQSMRDCLEGGIFAKPGQVPPDEVYHQYCTAIPVGVMLAQTWNRDLIGQVGRMVGEEMHRFGVTILLAPGMNLHRNPLCGRNFEYFSEDPVLTGELAAALVRGVQSVPGCGATLKHLACNNKEDNRMHSDSILSQRTLREIYCKSFEIAVKSAKPAAIMMAYNKINGIHCANSLHLCTTLVREEWGFGGLIMTDWTSTAQGPDCTASGCIRAGCDLIMPGLPEDRQDLEQALREGRMTEKALKTSAGRVAAVVRLGR